MTLPTGIEPAAGAARTQAILLVDDQKIFEHMVRQMLAEHPDLALHYCADGASAVAMAATIAPSVILQDLVMPGVNGLDLLDAYRQQEATKFTPLIVLSANEDAVTKAEAFRRGANDYLVKLPDAVELVARIRYHARTYRLLLQEKALNEAEKQRLITERHADSLRARNTLIFALAKLAESRDTDTGEHLERIAAYCRVLAEQLRAMAAHASGSSAGAAGGGGPGAAADDHAASVLDDTWILNLQLASSLHDIGKVGIPDAVLLKPGKLDAEERTIIERHPTIGADALDAILARDGGDALLRMARNIAASHHERWDGKGYPAKTAGEAIPLEARIVSVADVYDALTSKRVYKPAMSHEEALAIIVKGKGEQFDPQVVDALVQSEIVFRAAGQLLHEHEPPAP